MNTINERCLTFKWGKHEDTPQKAIQLASILKTNKIDFVCYGYNTNYYPCIFVIRKCGKKWNDIMKLINSIQSPKYNYVTIDFYITEENRKPLGNIQEVLFL